MNPHLVGDGDGAEAQPSHEAVTETAAAAADETISAESPTIVVPVVNLPAHYGSGTSTEVARFAHEPTVADLAKGVAKPAGDGRTRTGTVVAGELLVTVNTADGTLVAPCPPAQRPHPVLIAGDASARPRATGGHLLERDALCDRLRDRLGQGRCVRLTGAPGSGRSSVLDTVAAACAGLAPAGVVQLSGYRATAADLLQDLFRATHHAPGYRPGRDLLPGLLHSVGAIVVIDDVEFGGAALDELLSAAPECAFLVSSTPETDALLTHSRMEEVRLPGLSRQASLSLLARMAGRSLDETERAWAVDLWFESEGLPMRFVQAGALLRHREAAIEAMAAGLPAPDWDGSEYLDGGVQPLRPTPGGFDAYVNQHASDQEPLPDPVPLPSVAESAAPAVRIARGLSDPARRTLRLATALGGECPAAPHLPALIDVGHGEAALDELVEAGLATLVGAHHRLVDGVCAMLADEWPVAVATREAAQHFAWWTGHASVTEEQIAAEAEVLLAAMRADREAGRHAKVVLLARAAAPAFALALRWGAWERALRFGLESARVIGAVAEEAWFHHELGVLALCVGAYDRSRAELEASVALRAALGDTRGAAEGRAALGLLDEAGTLHSGRPIVLSVGGSSRSGLRRRAGLAAGRAGEGSVTRRQIAAAVLGVVLMGGLGSAVAFGLGAFRHGDRSAAVTVGPLASPSTTASADPGASGSASASVPGSATTAPTSATATDGGQPGTPGDTATGPGMTSAPAGPSQSRTASTPPATPPSSGTHTTPPPTTPPPSQSTSASASSSSSTTPSGSSSPGGASQSAPAP
jgi:hypothetical protein